MDSYKISGVKCMDKFIFHLLNIIILWPLAVIALIKDAYIVGFILGILVIISVIMFINNFTTTKIKIG